MGVAVSVGVLVWVGVGVMDGGGVLVRVEVRVGKGVSVAVAVSVGRRMVCVGVVSPSFWSSHATHIKENARQTDIVVTFSTSLNLFSVRIFAMVNLPIGTYFLITSVISLKHVRCQSPFYIKTFLVSRKVCKFLAPLFQNKL